MSASTIDDYTNIYFQVRELTRIHGEPTYPQLQLVLNQIKANASSVQSNLVGRIHSHLGHVFSPEDYEKVSLGTPYERLLMPAPLHIPTNMKIHKTQRLQAKIKEARKLYRETVDVEKALTKQIVAAIEKKYLQAIENTITKSITEQSVKKIVYTLTEPLITVLTQIEYLIMLAKTAKNPYSDRQLSEIAMNIIRHKKIPRKDKPTCMEKYQENILGKITRHTLKQL